MDSDKVRPTNTQILDSEKCNFNTLVQLVLNNDKCDGRVAINCGDDVTIHQLLYVRREGSFVYFFFDGKLHTCILFSDTQDLEAAMDTWGINQVTVFNENGEAKLYFSN